MSAVQQILLSLGGTRQGYDPYWKKVALLMPMDTTPTGFYRTALYGGNIYWSNSFDGYGDNISFDNTGNASSIGGAFTFECWFNLKSNLTYLGSFTRYQAQILSGSLASAFQIFVSSANSSTNVPTTISIGPYYAVGPAALIADGLDIPIDTWHHVAVARNDSNTLSIYFNGTRVATANIPGSYGPAGLLQIGGDQVDTSYSAWFPGYISNLRIVNGRTIYDPTSTAIEVPTTPLTAIPDTFLLTCQNFDFVDNSTNHYSVNVRGDTITSANNPFTSIFSQDSWSNYFSGPDFITWPVDNAFSLEIGDFTVEGWVFANTGPGESFTEPIRIFRMNSGTLEDYTFEVIDSTSIKFFAGSTGSVSIVWDCSFAVNNWNHVAWVRSSGVLKCYLNGFQLSVRSGNQSSTPNIINTAYSSLPAGDQNGTIYTSTPCYISNVRIVKGTAVYNSNFVPSLFPLKDIPGTVLLTCQSNAFVDSSSYNFPITEIGDPKISTISPFSNLQDIGGFDCSGLDWGIFSWAAYPWGAECDYANTNGHWGALTLRQVWNNSTSTLRTEFWRSNSANGPYEYMQFSNDNYSYMQAFSHPNRVVNTKSNSFGYLQGTGVPAVLFRIPMNMDVAPARVTTNITLHDIQGFSSSGNNLYVFGGISSFTSKNEVYKSTDEGVTWISLGTISGATFPADIEEGQASVYVQKLGSRWFMTFLNLAGLAITQRTYYTDDYEPVTNWKPCSGLTISSASQFQRINAGFGFDGRNIYATRQNTNSTDILVSPDNGITFFVEHTISDVVNFTNWETTYPGTGKIRAYGLNYTLPNNDGIEKNIGTNTWTQFSSGLSLSRIGYLGNSFISNGVGSGFSPGPYPDGDSTGVQYRVAYESDGTYINNVSGINIPQCLIGSGTGNYAQSALLPKYPGGYIQTQVSNLVQDLIDARVLLH
jgi:hypothetical protein